MLLFCDVLRVEKKGLVYHEAKLHINGDFLVGRYETDAIAATAYNKAADCAMSYGIKKAFPKNYIPEYSSEEYKSLYRSVQISKKLEEHIRRLSS